MPGKKASEESRREQIVQAAFRVAMRDGLEQLTIRQVAAEAGLGQRHAVSARQPACRWRAYPVSDPCPAVSDSS